MHPTHGKFVWYELSTTDAAAATEFYKKVMGWGAHDPHHSDHPYTMFTAGETGVGGVWELTDDLRARGVPPAWDGYIQVDDIEASATAVIEAGGKIVKPVAEIPNIGKFAVAVDPQGARFYLFQMPNAMAPHPMNLPGHVGWHELYARDHAADFVFYASLFGWNKSGAIDMGPMGTYQMFATGGEQTVGGMMNVPEHGAAGWMFYVNVDGADAAVARITAGGGQVLHGPQEVPGGQWIVQARDPQGATFAVVAPVK